MKRFLILIAPLVLLMLAFRPIKSHTITGIITDDTGTPVPSVSISVKGGTQGVLSDAKGLYRITVPKSSGTLVFSAVGYIAVQENISGRSVINVLLKKASTALREVMITKEYDGRKIKTMGANNRGIASGDMKAAPSIGFTVPVLK
ncbi:MAG: carboxypeptidase-like regulatory domain-containing protein [Chitinophagaceae bacterium]|nr:carboxypeptidase-like regulatory domain-containing protein [Chitinophagaceae bacterium]